MPAQQKVSFFSTLAVLAAIFWLALVMKAFGSSPPPTCWPVMENGGFIGNLYVVCYQNTASGAVMEARFNAYNTNTNNLRWVQFINGYNHGPFTRDNAFLGWPNTQLPNRFVDGPNGGYNIGGTHCNSPAEPFYYPFGTDPNEWGNQLNQHIHTNFINIFDAPGGFNGVGFVTYLVRQSGMNVKALICFNWGYDQNRNLVPSTANTVPYDPEWHNVLEGNYPGWNLTENISFNGGVPNDECGFAAPIGPGFTAFDTTLATTDGFPLIDFVCDMGPFGDEQIYNDIWYEYTAPNSGPTFVSTCNIASYDTRIAVYDNFGCPADPFLVQACDDDGPACADFTSELQFNANAGQSYLIRVGGFSPTSAGPGELWIGGGPPPCVPFQDLNCIVDEPFGQVILEWLNGEQYVEIIIIEDGVDVAVVPGTENNFVLPLPPPGPHTYTLVALCQDGTTVAISCDVIVGCIPFQALNCIVDQPLGQLVLEWINGEQYVEIIIIEDGVDVAVVPGTETNFVLPLPPPGPHNYTLIGICQGGSTVSISCAIDVPLPGGDFVRGQCNADNAFDISDPILLLAALFPMGSPPPLACESGCDVNGDGQLDIADAVAMLSALFGGGFVIPPPFPNCGPDPFPTGLSCDSSPCP